MADSIGVLTILFAATAGKQHVFDLVVSVDRFTFVLFGVFLRIRNCLVTDKLIYLNETSGLTFSYSAFKTRRQSTYVVTW